MRTWWNGRHAGLRILCRKGVRVQVSPFALGVSMKLIAAMVLSDEGKLLPYTCQSSMSACEEEAAVTLPWHRMKALGAKVVQVEIRTLDSPEPET